MTESEIHDMVWSVHSELGYSLTEFEMGTAQEMGRDYHLLIKKLFERLEQYWPDSPEKEAT